ncbi:MAG: prepilin-type N-terminal cleavage/methylation domain-containing protein [Ruminococcus sp.]|nr:prepilin-type N-terminal cleavage/methylation domain-containing protein [Ruminococcus sp.]
MNKFPERGKASVSTPKKLKGFTLIEVIIVIAIIGILASLIGFAMGLYIKDSRVQTANSNARLVFNTVQEWLIELEIKNIPLDDLLNKTAPGGSVTLDYGKPDAWNYIASNPLNADALNNYFRLSSASMFDDDMSNTYPALGSGNPWDGGAVTLSAINSSFTNEALINQAFKELQNAFSNTFKGEWTVIINADNYTVYIAYWQESDKNDNPIPGAMPANYRILNGGIGGNDEYLFPENGGAITFSTQDTRTTADPKLQYGVYPFADSDTGAGGGGNNGGGGGSGGGGEGDDTDDDWNDGNNGNGNNGNKNTGNGKGNNGNGKGNGGNTGNNGNNGNGNNGNNGSPGNDKGNSGNGLGNGGSNGKNDKP